MVVRDGGVEVQGGVMISFVYHPSKVCKSALGGSSLSPAW